MNQENLDCQMTAESSDCPTSYDNWDCQMLLGNETLLCGAFQNRPEKIAAIVVSIILTLADLLLLYGVIWYQYFGPDQSRTLVNWIFSSFCWSCMAALMIGVSDVARFILGPFPQHLCSVISFIKPAIRTEILLFFDAMALTRYIMIFGRKNPTAIDELFWHRFVCLVVTVASLIINLVQAMMPTQADGTFYVCCGVSPIQDSNLPKKQDGFVLLLSLPLQVFINARILIIKHDSKIKKAFQLLRLDSCKALRVREIDLKKTFDKETIFTTTAIIWGFIFSVAFMKLNIIVKSFSFEDLNQFPNYLYLYFLQLISFQLFGLVMLTVLYARHEKLFTTLYRNLRAS